MTFLVNHDTHTASRELIYTLLDIAAMFLSFRSSHYSWSKPWVWGTSLVVYLTLPLAAQSQESVQITESLEEDLGNVTSFESMTITESANVTKEQPSEQTLEFLQTPGTLGDPIQGVFTLPGMVQLGDNAEAPAVRGSAPEDNLLIVDDLPVGFLFHAFGNSVFDENLIHDFGLHPGGFGAEYGQATGGVFDVSLRDPQKQPIQTTLDLSFLKAGILVEGQASDSQAFYFSYRHSLIQYLLEGQIEDLEEEENVKIQELPTSRDYHGKYLWDINPETQVIFSLSGASDDFSVDLEDDNDDVLLDPGRAGNTALDIAYHNQSVTFRQEQGQIVFGHSLISQSLQTGDDEFIDFDFDQWILKGEKSWLFSQHEVTAGVDLTFGQLDYDVNFRFDFCDVFTPDCDINNRPILRQSDTEDFNFFDAFIQDAWQLHSTLTATLGVRIAHIEYTDEQFLEPRVKFEWEAVPDWTFTAAIGQYHQMQAIDILVPNVGNPDLESIESNHFVLGVEHPWGSDWSWKTEVYYKTLDNIALSTESEDVPYINGASGEAYGLEFLLKNHKAGRWSGWLSLSASKTERTNDETDVTEPFAYDLPLVANLVAQYELNALWTTGIRWTYRSGALYTPIIGNRENPDFPGFYLPVYGDFNSERARPYHRLDFRAERLLTGSLNGSFFVDIINVYNRKNSTGIEYEPIPDSDEFNEVEEETFGLIPSLGLKLIF